MVAFNIGMYPGVKRVSPKSPVRENRTPGSVRGLPGNREFLPRYSPVLGRWLNRDPIGELGGINQYMMGGNDPINQIDLLGLIWCWAETQAVAAAHRAYAGATLAFAGQSLIVSGLLAAWYIADNAADIACLAVPPARAVYNTCRRDKSHECCLTECAVYTGLKDSCDTLKQIADDLMEQYSDASDLLTALGSVVADAAREIARADRALHDCIFGP